MGQSLYSYLLMCRQDDRYVNVQTNIVMAFDFIHSEETN